MKIFFVLAAIFALVLTGCDGSPDHGEIGKTGQGGGIIFFAESGEYKECSGELGDSTWNAAMTTAKNYQGGGYTDWHLPDRTELDLMYKNLKQNDLGGFSGSGYWTSGEYNTNLAYCQHFDLVDYSYNIGKQVTESKSDSFSIRAVRSYTTNTVDPEVSATLKIKNQSFTEITDVIWNNVTFSNNQYEKTIKIGTEVTKAVNAGGGYIFFKRKSNPVNARTAEIIIVEKDQQAEFTFTDNTVIVEVNNANNNGTLSSVQSTVVWWDDAEGEMQPYHLKQSFVGYYKDKADLLSSLWDRVYPPKNGTKSIAVGGTNTALLHLKINLERKAKLSFWYANKYSSTGGAVFSINSIEKAKWTTDINWSFMTFDLAPGENNIIWTKKDGVNSNGDYFYLSIDDILIYYTE